MAAPVPVTVAIPGCERIGQLLKTLEVVLACNPPPAEIIVHLDGASPSLAAALVPLAGKVKILTSEERVGPGGARHHLVRQAAYEYVASFDDDSYPEDPAYFQRLMDTFHQYPDAALLAASINTGDSCSQTDAVTVAEFIGCGCVYRKSWYERLPGYVPRPVAYGMEEQDLSLQLYEKGGRILKVPALRVTHDRIPDQRYDSSSHEEVLLNSALLPFLRYPFWLLPLAIWHFGSRFYWELRHGTVLAAVRGVMRLPATLQRYRAYRNPVSTSSVFGWLRLRRNKSITHQAIQ